VTHSGEWQHALHGEALEVFVGILFGELLSLLSRASTLSIFVASLSYQPCIVLSRFLRVLLRRRALPYAVVLDGVSFTLDVFKSLHDDVAAPRQSSVTKFVSRNFIAKAHTNLVHTPSQQGNGHASIERGIYLALEW
jgi:hypothetical protein